MATIKQVYDGKRTAATALDLVLELNGHVLTVPEDDYVAMMYQLASGDLLFDDFVVWVRDRLVSPHRAT